MKADNPISIDELRSFLRYDEATGEFYRLSKSPRWKNLEKPFGWVNKHLGYRMVRINRRDYYAHRLAWFYVHGKWPDNQIDHINLDRSDNRISNLREANNSENNMNRRIQSNNRSGVKGVYWDKQTKRWRAEIKARGKRYRIGRYDSLQEASEAYKSFSDRLFGEFARTE